MRSEKFSSHEEIINTLTEQGLGKSGPVLHVSNGNLYTYGNEGHQIMLGSTGVGKSRRGIMPLLRALLEANESIICVDPKGELYKNTACYAEGSHSIKVVNFRNPARSVRWNPLALPYELYARGEKGQAQQMIQEIVFSLVADEGGRTDDKYWVDSERGLLAGIINLLIETCSKDFCTLAQILNIIRQDWDSLSSSDTIVSGGYLLDVVETLPNDSQAKQLLSSYTGLSARVTRSCIMTSAVNTLSKFCTTEDIVTMTSADDIDIVNMNMDTPFVLYNILPDDSNIFNTLSGLLVSQISKQVIKLADNKYDGKLPIRVNFILEELGNIGHSVAELPFLMTAARSRNVRMTLVLQALSQLESIYPGGKAQTILSCADVWICFRTSDWSTLRELSQKCGMKKISAGSISYTQQLISETQLMAMDTGQALILISGRIKYIEIFPDYTDLFYCEDLEEIPLPYAVQSEEMYRLTLSALKNRILANNKPVATGTSLKDKFFASGGDKDAK